MTPTCVILGGTGDIGGAIAEQLIDAGWTIVTVSRHIATSSKRTSVHVVADVASEESIQAAVQQILKNGPVDAVVYAVGLPPDVHVALADYESADWHRTFGAYVDGLFYVYKAFFPALGDGSHFFVISSAITRLKQNELPPFHAGHYAAAKAAVNEFSKWARREAHHKGVLLSRFAPGSVRSAASALLRVPEGNSLPLDVAAGRVVAALIGHEEVDEEMVTQSS